MQQRLHRFGLYHDVPAVDICDAAESSAGLHAASHGHLNLLFRRQTADTLRPILLKHFGSDQVRVRVYTTHLPEPASAVLELIEASGVLVSHAKDHQLTAMQCNFECNMLYCS